jgi:hypothetical protein
MTGKSICLSLDVRMILDKYYKLAESMEKLAKGQLARGLYWDYATLKEMAESVRGMADDIINQWEIDYGETS